MYQEIQTSLRDVNPHGPDRSQRVNEAQMRRFIEDDPHDLTGSRIFKNKNIIPNIFKIKTSVLVIDCHKQAIQNICCDNNNFNDS